MLAGLFSIPLIVNGENCIAASEEGRAGELRDLPGVNAVFALRKKGPEFSFPQRKIFVLSQAKGMSEGADVGATPFFNMT